VPLFAEYTGPQVRLLRYSDNQKVDVWFDKANNITKAVLASNSNTTVDIYTWLGQTDLKVIDIWYNQSANGRHLTSNDNRDIKPIFIYDGVMQRYTAHFVSNRILSSINLFNSNTITNMQMLMRSHEISRTGSFGVNFNGNNQASTGRFSMHIPWENGVWYWDPNDVGVNRVVSAITTTSVGAVTEASAYKSSTISSNGLEVNGAKYQSSGFSAGTVTNGLLLGTSTDTRIQYFIVFDSKTTDAQTQNIFNMMKAV
jgi:hypothetical protein